MPSTLNSVLSRRLSSHPMSFLCVRVFFATEFSLSDTPFCPSSHPFLHRISFLPRNLDILLLPHSAFSLLFLPSPITIFPTFSRTWYPKVSSLVTQYSNASSSRTFVLSFGFRARRGLQRHSAFFLEQSSLVFPRLCLEVRGSASHSLRISGPGNPRTTFLAWLCTVRKR